MSDQFDFIIDPDDLPSPPGVAVRLLEIFDDPDASLDDFSEIISTDAALVAKVIEFCNSPLNGQRNKATSLRQAMVVLGLRSVKLIALSFSLVKTDSDSESNFDLNAFWKHSFATALISKKLAETSGHDGNEAFLSGLMLNIGHIALNSATPEKYQELWQQVSSTDLTIRAAEFAKLCKSEWSSNQYQVGAQLLDEWNFPGSLCDVLKEYTPNSATDTTEALPQILGIAERLGVLINSENFSLEDIQQLETDTCQFLDKSKGDFEELIDLIMTEWMDYANMLELEDVTKCDLRQLEKRARKTSRQLSLALSAESESIKSENDTLKTEIAVDLLTGLKNRRAYDQDGPAKLSAARINKHNVAVVVADIDHFKSVNDRFGHAAGDAVLSNTARLMESSLRADDCIYRIGGEEFVILLGDCDLDSMKAVCERIRMVIESSSVRFEENSISFTVSQGAILVSPSCELPLDELFQMADKLLYEAKTNGRNQVRSEVAQRLVPSNS